MMFRVSSDGDNLYTTDHIMYIIDSHDQLHYTCLDPNLQFWGYLTKMMI